MKVLISIIVGTSIMLSGLTPAFGISLLGGKTPSVNRWTYIFIDRYIYDYAGLHWDHERVYRISGYGHHNDRWYYHYGHKLKPYNEHRYYRSHGYMPKAHVYNQPNFIPKNNMHRKPILMRDRIPRNSFRHRSPFPRARIGR